MPTLESDEEIRALLSGARTIAVVGMSDKPHRDSYQVGRYLHNRGYIVIPVNPAIPEVLGIPAVPDLDGIRFAVDIVDIFRRVEHVPEVVEAAVRCGARAVWMQFGAAHPGAAARAAAAGLCVVTNRCIMVDHQRLLR
jgi:predicted CoA-binding protein